jgi:uncharacterized protein YndB with AHSA1/START domain
MTTAVHGDPAQGCVVECVVGAEPAHVFEILADGWLYPLWVVGATHMRMVDAQWPEPGARLHHKVGVWPLALEDTTEVEAVEPQRRLVLIAHGGAAGSARIEIVLEPVEGGTRVRMTEHAISGPGRFIPKAVQAVLLRPRNTESLQRLRAIAENRGQEAGG